jgi:uncharacterized membrane protein
MDKIGVRHWTQILPAQRAAKQAADVHNAAGIFAVLAFGLTNLLYAGRGLFDSFAEQRMTARWHLATSKIT